jgi:hypothetical protein
MRTCPSCGGIIGRDCFNPIECAEITYQMNVYDAIDNFHREEEKKHYEQMQRDYQNDLEADYNEYLQSEEIKLFATIDNMTNRFLKVN